MASHFQFGDFELHTLSRVLLAGGSAVAVEPKVFDVLSYLVENRERAVGRDELIAAVWGRVDVADATLQQAISRLRRVLRETPEQLFVRTVPRHGYQWVAPTVVVASAAAAPPVPLPPAVVAETPLPMPAPQPASSPVTTRRRLVVAASMLLVATVILVIALMGWQAKSPAHTSLSAPDSPDTSLAQPACKSDLPASQCLAQLSALLADTTRAPPARAALLLERAQYALRSADTQAATADLDAADGLMDPPSQPGLAARALFLRHRVALAAGRSDEALAYGQRALAIYRGQAQSSAYAELLHSLGAAAGRKGELERALSGLTAALQMYDALQDDEGASRVLATTAYTLSQLGRFADALAAARQAQARAGYRASPEVRREALISLAWASIQTGRLGEAREAVHQALDLASASDSPQQLLSLRALLGFIDAAGGRFQEALVAWDDALTHTPEGSQNRAVAGLRLAVVYAALNVGDREQAQKQSDQLEQMAEQSAEFKQSAQHAAALLALADGKDEQAYTLFSQVWLGARASGSLNQQMLADYAEVLIRRQDLDTLETLLGEPSLPADEGYLYQLVRARYLAHRRRHADAQAAFDRARALAGERYSRWLEVARREIKAPDTQR